MPISRLRGSTAGKRPLFQSLDRAHKLTGEAISRRDMMYMLELREEIHDSEPGRDEIDARFGCSQVSLVVCWDVYCKAKPGGLYTDLEDKIRACANTQQ